MVEWIFCKTKRKFFVLELNTVPGMTDHSLFPYAASLKGFSFDELVMKLQSKKELFASFLILFLVPSLSLPNLKLILLKPLMKITCLRLYKN